MDYFTKEVTPSLFKLSFKLHYDLAKLELVSFVKLSTTDFFVY